MGPKMNYDEIFSQLPEQAPEQTPVLATCFAFSVHKCGSTLMNNMIAATCRKANIPAVSLPGILFAQGIKDADWRRDYGLLPAFERQLLFYGFRYLPEILGDPASGMLDKRFVLLVRDPRDALVSEYFSYGKKSGSHVLPGKNTKAFADQIPAQISAQIPDQIPAQIPAEPDRTIDDYVIGASRGILAKLETYRDTLDFDLGLVRRYEDVFFDKETFLGEIFDHFGLSVGGNIIRNVARAHDIRPAQEDETQHIRKGTPGDHREKLLPQTIARLNELLRDVGGFYGYRF